MSKLSNMLSMLVLLQRGGIHSISELSETLEVSKRQVRRYRDALEMTGIYVHSKTGKNGGYYLDTDSNMEMLDMQFSEELGLFSKVFEDDKNLSMVNIVDIYKTIGHDLMDDSTLFDDYSLHYIKHLIMIHYAINKKNIILIEYLTKDKLVVNRKVHPYFVFKKHKQHYLAAFEPNRNHIIYFRMNRISKLVFEENTFTIDNNALESSKKVVNENQGVFYDGTYEQVRFRCHKDIRNLIKEVFNENIEIRTINGEIIEVTMKVGNVEEIKHSLLSFGSKIKVIEPESLRKAMKREFEKALSHYES